jgi:hypothetical protein
MALCKISLLFVSVIIYVYLKNKYFGTYKHFARCFFQCAFCISKIFLNYLNKLLPIFRQILNKIQMTFFFDENTIKIKISTHFFKQRLGEKNKLKFDLVFILYYNKSQFYFF